MYLGIDFGLKRIGIAISDNGKMARPLCCIPYKGDVKTLARIKEIIDKNTISGVVCSDILLCIGVANGSLVPHVKRFGELLRAELGVKVEYVDEDFTSIEAEDYIRNVLCIRDYKKVKELLDAVSATMILNKYLEKKGV